MLVQETQSGRGPCGRGIGEKPVNLEAATTARTSRAPRPRVENAIIIKALARAFRWLKMLDTGVHATLEELARAKGVHATYVSRVLRLTLLAPEIVEAILDGRQPAVLQLDNLLAGFPVEGEGQSANLEISGANQQG